MNIEDVVNYVNDSPANTNENVLRSMLQRMGGSLPTGQLGQILRQGDGKQEFTDQCFYIQIQSTENVSVSDFTTNRLTSLTVQNKSELLNYLDSDMTIPCKILYNGNEFYCQIDGDYIKFSINSQDVLGYFFIDVADDCHIYFDTISIPKTISGKINIQLMEWTFNFDEERGMFYVVPNSVWSNFGGAQVEGFDPTWFNEEQAEIEVYINDFTKVERLPNLSDGIPVFFNKQNNIYFSLSMFEVDKGETQIRIILLPIITHEGVNEKYINCCLSEEDNIYILGLSGRYPFPKDLLDMFRQAGYGIKLYLSEQIEESARYTVQGSREYNLFAQGTDTAHNTYTTIALNEYSGDLPDPEMANFCIYEGTITTNEFSQGGLPDVTVSDSGKVLGVNVDGEWDVLEQRVSTKYKVTNEDLQTIDPNTGISVAASKFFDPMITDIYFDAFLLNSNTFIPYINAIGNYLISQQYSSIIPTTIHAYNLSSSTIHRFVYTEGTYGAPTFSFQYTNCFGDVRVTFGTEDITTASIDGTTFFIRTPEQEEGSAPIIDIPLSVNIAHSQGFINHGVTQIELIGDFSCDLRLVCWNEEVE